MGPALFNKSNQHRRGRLEDMAHVRYLAVLLSYIVLVNTDRVYPELSRCHIRVSAVREEALKYLVSVSEPGHQR